MLNITFLQRTLSKSDGKLDKASCDYGRLGKATAILRINETAEFTQTVLPTEYYNAARLVV